MELVNQWAEIVLRNLAWTGGWVVAAVLLFLLCVAVIGGRAGNGNKAFTAEVAEALRKAKDQGARARKPSDLIRADRCGASRGAECPRCLRRDEAARDRRIRELEKVVAECGPGEVHEPRRSRRVGPPNPRAGGEPATGRRIDRVA